MIWPWSELESLRRQLKWERDAVAHWQNMANFYRANWLQTLRNQYGMQKGIRRLVEKVKRLRRES